VNSQLHKQLFTFAACGSLALVLLFTTPLLFDTWPAALQRLVQSLLVWTLIWQQLWHYRSLNRSSECSPLLPSLGWANSLTLLRGALFAACAGFLWLPAPKGLAAWLPAFCYTLAVLADRLDGELARRSNTTTLLGAKLDTSYDAIGLVVAPLLAISYGKLHPSYLLVSAAYYFFVFGIHSRQQHNLPVLPLATSALRRTLAGCQMAVVAMALWPSIAPLLSQFAGFVFMLPLLLHFWIDWLVVSARLSCTTEITVRQLVSLSWQWLLKVH
jgi:CDP-diacylglycerol--glycerol-3-phosphate 3-phosphatidyltransferase